MLDESHTSTSKDLDNPLGGFDWEKAKRENWEKYLFLIFRKEIILQLKFEVVNK